MRAMASGGSIPESGVAMIPVLRGVRARLASGVSDLRDPLMFFVKLII